MLNLDGDGCEDSPRSYITWFLSPGQDGDIPIRAMHTEEVF